MRDNVNQPPIPAWLIALLVGVGALVCLLGVGAAISFVNAPPGGDSLPTQVPVAVVPSATRTLPPTLTPEPSSTIDLSTPTATSTLSVTATLRPSPTPRPTLPPLPTSTPFIPAPSPPPRVTQPPVVPTATRSPSPTPTATRPPDAWQGEYFNNRDLSGSPTLTRLDNNVDFNWSTAAPASGLPADNFSVRWTRTLAFGAGTYRFNVRSDDGVRIWLDNQLVIDEWHDAGNVTYSVDRTLITGDHSLRIDYYEGSGTAQIQFWWDNATQYPQWRAEYYSNPNLDGAPTLIRNDVEVNFDWGKNPPATNIPVDRFSIRWT
ncbi:MAG: PA14 domain-containing protein, partial [Chloroflexi bacterium]|nr:PA14 domain-containing protein [Chloroflexota bacterium]